MSQWIVHDASGQPMIIELGESLIVLQGKRFDVAAIRLLRLHLGAALREAIEDDRP